MINVRGLCKKFDDFEALNNLNVNVEKGSIYGLIGVMVVVAGVFMFIFKRRKWM
jgi:LPXTG-motif cell wall-anchored protein